MELRDLIADRLVDLGQHPWGQRVSETHAMTADLGLPPFGILPWLSVRQAGTTVDLERVQSEMFEVWVHAENTSFAALDALEQLVVRLLDRRSFTDPDATPPRTWALGYDGTLLGDQVIDAWDAYARGVRFSTTAGILGGAGAVDDPRARYLRENPQLLFCDPAVCVQTDPATWQPRDDCPGVYIRPISGPWTVTHYAAFTQLRETLAVHVITPTPAAQHAWVDALALQLPVDVRYVERDKTDSAGHRPRVSTLGLRVAQLTPAADPLTDGQIRLEATFTELACDMPDLGEPLREIVAEAGPPHGYGPHITVRARTPTPAP